MRALTLIRFSSLAAFALAGVLLLLQAFVFSSEPVGDQRVVVVVDQTKPFFAPTYDQLFNDLGATTDYVVRSRHTDTQIRQTIGATDDDVLILVGYGASVKHVLESGLSEDPVATILFSPPPDLELTSDILDAWADRHILILDADTKHAVVTYELLSSEDATLFGPSDSKNGITQRMHMSVDARIWFLRFRITGIKLIDELIYPCFPQVQARVGDFYQTVIDNDDLDTHRTSMMSRYAVFVLAATMMLSGLLAFLSTLPRVKPQVTGDDPALPEAPPRRVLTDEAKGCTQLFKKKMPLALFLTLILALALTVTCFILPERTGYLLFAWPGFYVCGLLSVLMKIYLSGKGHKEINRTRKIFSGLAGALWLVAILACVVAFVSWPWLTRNVERLFFGLVITAVIFFAELIRTAIYSDRCAFHKKRAAKKWRVLILDAVLYLPYLILFIRALIYHDAAPAIASVALLLWLLFARYVGRAFYMISNQCGWAAAMMTATYVLPFFLL